MYIRAVWQSVLYLWAVPNSETWTHESLTADCVGTFQGVCVLHVQYSHYKRAVWRQTESGDKNGWPICCQNSKEQWQVCCIEWSRRKRVGQPANHVLFPSPLRALWSPSHTRETITNLDHQPFVNLFNIVHAVKKHLDWRSLLVNWEVSLDLYCFTPALTLLY